MPSDADFGGTPPWLTPNPTEQLAARIDDLIQRINAGQLSPDCLDDLAAQLGQLAQRIEQEQQRRAGDEPADKAQGFFDQLTYEVELGRILQESQKAYG